VVRRGKQSPEPDRALERKFETWARRASKSQEQSPEELLAQAQDVLRWSIRKNGPDSSLSIKAMNEVANQLSQLERVAEEAPLREKIAEGLRASVGPDHLSTLSAEWKLATCLMTLGRPEEAEPLLAHVVRQRAGTLGEDDTPRHASSRSRLWRGTNGEERPRATRRNRLPSTWRRRSASSTNQPRPLVSCASSSTCATARSDRTIR